MAETFASWKITLFSWIGETCVSPGSIWSILQSWMSYLLFLYENWVTMWRNMPYLSSFSCGKNIHSMGNIPIHQNRRNPCISWKNTIYVRSMSALCMFSHWQLRYSVNRILPSSQCFWMGEICPLWYIVQFSWIAETCVSPLRIPSVLKADMPCPLFPYDNLLRYERNIPYKSAFLTGEKVHFMEYNPIQLNWRNTWIPWKDTFNVTCRMSCPLFTRRTGILRKENHLFFPMRI
jgi:hypothetical protein